MLRLASCTNSTSPPPYCGRFAPVNVSDGSYPNAAALEDYGPPLKIYQSVGDQFRAGKSVIVIATPAKGA